MAPVRSLGHPRVKTDISLSYVDHNTLQMNFRNPDDHRFLRTVAAKFGGVYSGPGTGICHQLHLENFAKPGATLVGSDSPHPPPRAASARSPWARGRAFRRAGDGGRALLYPHAQGRARLPDRGAHRLGLRQRTSSSNCSAAAPSKGGVGRVFEYAGPASPPPSVPERATIANMGAELGATGTLFPSDGVTRAFLKRHGPRSRLAGTRP